MANGKEPPAGEAQKVPAKVTAKQIKAAIMELKVPKEKHQVAGVDVWVHGLTSYQLEDWRQLKNNPEGTDANLTTAKLIQLALRDESGAPVFTEKELAIIAGRPAMDIEPLSRAILKLSGFGPEAEAAVLKNLLKTLGDAGLSESPESTSVQ